MIRQGRSSATLATIAAVLAALSGAVAQPAATPAPYLLMVTSLDPPLAQLSDAQAGLLGGAPFDGVAISLLGIYDGRPLPEEAALLARCQELRRPGGPTLWPRLYLNRCSGFLPSRMRREACQAPEYFDRIAGFDLWDEAGARTEFLRLWRLGLRAARALGAPGVVADFESYNLGGLGNPVTLAALAHRSLPDTQAALRALGAQLADLTAEEYPEAIIWSLFTGLGEPARYRVEGQALPLLQTYIFEGLLQRAAERAMPLRLVSGGETTLGYYSPSVAALRGKLAARAEGFGPARKQAGERLALGGTIVLWNDARRLTGWVRESAGATPPYQCFADFSPLLRELFAAYRYVWVYVPMVTDYNPFDAATAPGLNAALREVLRASPPRMPSSG